MPQFGNKVLRWYLDHKRNVTPINPSVETIEGLRTLPAIENLPNPKETAISIVTPPPVTEKIVEAAIKIGIPALWMQPGSESPKAIARATEGGLLLLAGGPCILRDTKSFL